MKNILRFAFVLSLIFSSSLMAKNWTWYIQSTNVVSGSPGYIDVTLGIRANSSGDEGRLGNNALIGGMSADLYEIGTYAPIVQTNHLTNYTMVMQQAPLSPNWWYACTYDGSTGGGALVTTGGIAVVTIRFFIFDPSGTSNITLGTFQETYEDDNITSVTVSFDNSGGDVSLPVELSSFNAVVEPNFVTLNWITESEVNNLGFEVYRAPEEGADYLLLSSYETNPDLAGQGNSNTQQEYSYKDESVEPETTYWYKLSDVDFNGIRTFHDPISVEVPKAPEIPTVYKLHSNYPNPFNPTTTLRFDIPGGAERVDGKLVIYNSLGQEIKTLVQDKFSPGSYEVQWDGRTDFGNSAPSGIYFVVFRTDRFSQTGKLLLLK